MAENSPLIQLEPGGVAPVLRYDIPEPTSYEGRNFIALSFGDDVFLPVASEMPSSAAFRELKELPRDVLRAELSTFVRTGVSDRTGVRELAVPVARRAPGPSGLDAGLTGIAPVARQATDPLPPDAPEPPDEGVLRSDDPVHARVGSALPGTLLLARLSVLTRYGLACGHAHVAQ